MKMPPKNRLIPEANRLLVVLYVITISNLQLAKSESGQIAPEDASLKIDASEEITMQWCGRAGEQPPTAALVIPQSISEEDVEISVKLKAGGVSCPTGVESSEFTLEIDRPSSNKSLNYGAEFSTRGYFRAGDYYYPPGGFCMTKFTNLTYSVRVCGTQKTNVASKGNISSAWSYPECGRNNTCLPKCCPMNKIFTLAAGQTRIGRCQRPLQDEENLTPSLYSSPYTKIDKGGPLYYYKNPIQRNLETRPQFWVHESSQINREFLNATSICFRVRQDGVLLYHDLKGYWVEVSPEDYCLNGYQLNGTQKNPETQYFLGDGDNVAVFMRIKAESHETTVTKRFYSIMYGSTFLVASAFLLVTFAVYVLLWKEQKIQGWITMSHTITMFFLYFHRGLNYFWELRATEIGRAYRSLTCMVSGIFTHYYFLSNFCWLTIVCFSLYWTFRGIHVGNPHAKDRGQYLAYAAFGWGLPFVFVTISVLLDQKYSYEPCNEVIVPEYGIGTCSVSIGALGPYKYYPVALLLLLNLLFFSMTFYKLNEYKKSASSASKALKSNKQLFQVILKLFFVMGFTWTFELILWCWWWLSGTDRKWFRAATNLINCLLAVTIFVIYVCKSSVAGSLKNNYPSLRTFLTIMGNKSETSATMPSTSMEAGERQILQIKFHQRNRDGYN